MSQNLPITRKTNLPPPISHPKFTYGFTLIELIVVMGIMALLFTLGYANYRGFQRSQQLETAVEDFKTDLRLAQQLANSGKKPSGCSTLAGYRVIRAGNDSYEIAANCGGNERCSTGPEYCVKEVELTGITIGSFPAPGSRFMFLVLSQGVDRDASISFSLDSTGESKTVEVTTAGEIYE